MLALALALVVALIARPRHAAQTAGKRTVSA
jgi:hypothetical protein